MADVHNQITLGEAASRFLASLPIEERVASQPVILRFVHWYGRERSLASLAAPEVARYAEQMSRSEIGYDKKLGLVRAFLGYIRKKGWLQNNLVGHLKAKRGAKSGSSLVSRRGRRESIPKTQSEYDKMKKEMVGLKSRRLKAIEDMRLAAADKDFRENAPLDAAREQRALIEGKIKELEAVIKSVVVIDKTNENKGAGSRVGVGDSVILRDLASGQELRYTIVSPRDVDPSRGRISSASPLGKAILGKGVGEVIEITAPAAKLGYKIEGIGR